VTSNTFVASGGKTFGILEVQIHGKCLLAKMAKE
jgi:hypothetical protein